jgi:hypothetical protein
MVEVRYLRLVGSIDVSNGSAETLAPAFPRFLKAAGKRRHPTGPTFGPYRSEHPTELESY